MSTPHLTHEIRVFVFRYQAGRPDFLLLRRRPRVENELGPVHGPVELSEHLRDAVIREVREETGLIRPAHLIDLDHASKLVVGDEGLIQWEFGYQAPETDVETRLHPGPEVAEAHWLPFEGAFQHLPNPEDRSALIRLQMLLQAG